MDEYLKILKNEYIDKEEDQDTRINRLDQYVTIKRELDTFKTIKYNCGLNRK